jgi:hypothetical protein
MKTQYRDWKLDVEAGDVILYHTGFSYKPVSWLALLIRLFTKSYWNHAGLVVQIEGRLFISEALGGGVRVRPLSYYLDRRFCKIKLLKLKAFHEPGALPEITARAFDKLGCKYDIKNLFDHLWKAITGGKWTGYTENHAAGAMVCSEYVAYCYSLKGWWMWTAGDLDAHPDFYSAFDETNIQIIPFPGK